ncbi:hypothetical protein [Haloarcula salinisoli]|uniref:DUF2178 domain-containing protein n=1 Tax=Haloarcula salinisoli TaxID=2487746 RepID=A0A8J8C7C6_9EURY|nr:hypothetical protein [Halomicroarcula salinisoli]MBX0285315.1 hypothetical protein [Halomicroarcula salinisoli]MBX0303206.1 hypothetical protein [Halomicroarcula salinisoli]
MTDDRSQNALLGLSMLGVVVTIWSATLRPWELALAVTTGGIGLIFGPILLMYVRSDGTFSVWGLGRVDERAREIEAKAARNAWFAVLPLLVIFLISSQYRPWEPTGNVIAIAVTLVGTITLVTSLGLYESRM